MESKPLPITIFYDDRQNVETVESFSPSAKKPKLVVESWMSIGIPFTLISNFTPMSREDFYQVHDKKFVDDLLDLKIPNGFGNTSQEIAESLPWTSGSMVAAAVTGLKYGVNTFSPTSGFHHAGYDFCGSFCSLNALALAAMKCYEAGAKRVGILDLDMHHGDGTQDIIDKLGLDWIQHYSFGNLGITTPEDGAKWLQSLRQDLYSFESCDIIIYNAGVDVHEDDPLGGLFTTPQIADRDDYVFEVFRNLGIPIATSLAGGYQQDESGTIQPIIDLHDNTFLACFDSMVRKN